MRIPIEQDGRPTSHLEVRVERARGAGSASVLYLHGFGSCQDGEKADFFRTRATTAGLDFWSFDFQGHGGSGGGMRDLTLSRNLADLQRVRDAMTADGVERVVLLGSSMGGLSGLWHSVELSQGIVAGLYIAPAVGLEGAFRGWAGPDGLERWERDGVFEIRNELGSWELGWGFVEDLGSYPNDRLAAGLTVPSLLLQGKRDDRVDWRQVAGVAAACASSGTELHLFEDGGHRLVSRREQLWELMLAFLEAREIV